MSPKHVVTASSFASEVQADVERLRSLCHTANEAASNDKPFRKAFAAQVAALAPCDSTLQHADFDTEHRTQSPHDLQSISEATLCLCNKLVSHYNEVSKAVDAAKPNNQLATGWEEDLGQLRRLLDIGYTIAKAKIDIKMSQDTNEHEAGEQDQGKTTQQIDEEREAVALLGLCDPEACIVQDRMGKPLAMNEMLRNAEKGVACLTKGLPEESDDS